VAQTMEQEKHKVVQEWMISYIDETKRKMDQQRVG